MKRALLIGIDDYRHFPRLSGCVNDVAALAPLLERNEDGSHNFDVRRMTSDELFVGRTLMRSHIADLLAPGADVGVLYFAGHGKEVSGDVILVAQDGERDDLGISLGEVLAKVRTSPLPEVVIILDCCHSGGAGAAPQLSDTQAVLPPGCTILTATRRDQRAAETEDRRGAFSAQLCAALEGGAADLLGDVSMAGLYAFLSQAFGPWEQRPTFKANVDRLHALRCCVPDVPREELRLLPTLFPVATNPFPLDPSYEPEAEPHHPEHQETFATLQRMRDAQLVEAVGTRHLYHAAVRSRSCQLTRLGWHYWHLARRGWV